MTSEKSCVGANVARLRAARRLTQQQIADRAMMTRVAVSQIERGAVSPRASTVTALAKALDVPLGDLMTPVSRLEGVRFRAGKRMRAREHVLARVAGWLEGYADLENALDERRTCKFAGIPSGMDPQEAARAARRAVGLDYADPVRDICGLLEENGVKVLLYPTQRESVFGLSVSVRGGGPAVVVNTWDRISVERWIFTAAHELGHLLLHPDEFRREVSNESSAAEREADAFAGEFLMPEVAFDGEWAETWGHPLVDRVLKVKRIFRVSYKTVLHRLVETGRETGRVWSAFQAQHRAWFGKTLARREEPQALEESEFAWNWRRAGEPAGLSSHDFMEDRLWRLIRKAVENGHISLARAAEIAGLDREHMRQRARAWSQ